jgi:hypothetical protein
MDVFAVAVVILCVPDTMVREALLPDQKRISKFSLGSKRKAALDELQSPSRGTSSAGVTIRWKWSGMMTNSCRRKRPLVRLSCKTSIRSRAMFSRCRIGRRPLLTDVTKTCGFPAGPQACATRAKARDSTSSSTRP